MADAMLHKAVVLGTIKLRFLAVRAVVLQNGLAAMLSILAKLVPRQRGGAGRAGKYGSDECTT